MRKGYHQVARQKTHLTAEQIDKFLIPGEGAYEDRDPDMPFAFMGEMRKSLRMLPEVRDQRFSEVMDESGAADWQELGAFSTPIPDGVLNAFREALPEIARRKDLFRVGLHPWFKRVCLFQRTKLKNGHLGWIVAFLFCGDFDFDPNTNLPRLPRDLAEINHDGRYDYLAGQFGEFYSPRDKRDWQELAALADNQKQRVKGERGRMIMANRERAYAEKNSRLEAIRHDTVHYRKHQLVAAVNEDYGSMQGLPIMGTDPDRPALDRARIAEKNEIVEKDGYRVLTRKPLSSEGHEKFPRGLEKRMPEVRRVEYQDARVVHVLENAGRAPRQLQNIKRVGVRTLC